MGQHVRRSQGPAHRLRPVRAGSTASRRRPSAARPRRPRSRSSTCRSAARTASCGRSTACTSWSTATSGAQCGLYRVRSKDGGDTFEKPEAPAEAQRQRRARRPRGPARPGRQIAVHRRAATARRCSTRLTASRVPRLWGEDHLLPRMPDGNGFMAGVLGPGGCIYKIDPDGKNWELVSTGYRNRVRRRLQPRRRAVHLRRRHGMGHEHAVVSADARLPGDQRQRVRLAQRLRQMAAVLPRQPAGHLRRRPRLADRHVASATAPSSPPSIRTPCSCATGATASSTPCT